MVAFWLIFRIPSRPGAVEDVANDMLISPKLRHGQFLKLSISETFEAAIISGAIGSASIGVKRLGHRQFGGKRHSLSYQGMLLRRLRQDRLAVMGR